jgi:hypothetical protein
MHSDDLFLRCAKSTLCYVSSRMLGQSAPTLPDIFAVYLGKTEATEAIGLE